MSKDLSISVLLDYYGEMLTEKQKDLVELYYNEDLSLGEISENEGITRQGVRDSIKRGEAFLLELEEKLHLVENSKRIANDMNEILSLVKLIYKENERFKYSTEITKNLQKIVSITDKYLDNDN